MGQLWATNSLGGYLSAKNLDKKLRTANQPLAKFRQFSEVQNAIGKHVGQTFTWDIISNVATQGGTLVETNTMPETNFTITQGTLTVTEAGKSIAALFSNLVNYFSAVIIGRHMAVVA